MVRRTRVVITSPGIKIKPDYELYCERLKSFTSWPIGIKQRPEELAAAGFYYSGYGDQLFCFSCGLEMCQLEPDANPWVEHEKILNSLNKNCAHLDFNHKVLIINQMKNQQQINSKKTEILELKHDEIEDDTVNKSDEDECKICFNRKSNIAFIPCGHVAVCSQCVFGIGGICPICRGEIREKIVLVYS